VLVGPWMSKVRQDDTCQNARVRIGTWDLESKWSSEASIPEMTVHCTAHAMCPRKGWAGIFSSRDLTTQPNSHPATPSSLRERINETPTWGDDGNQALDGRDSPSHHRPVLALDREVLAPGLLATSDGGAT
jgi:hypothetical protein